MFVDLTTMPDDELVEWAARTIEDKRRAHRESVAAHESGEDARAQAAGEPTKAEAFQVACMACGHAACELHKRGLNWRVAAIESGMLRGPQ